MQIVKDPRLNSTCAYRGWTSDFSISLIDFNIFTSTHDMLHVPLLLFRLPETELTYVCFECGPLDCRILFLTRHSRRYTPPSLPPIAITRSSALFCSDPIWQLLRLQSYNADSRVARVSLLSSYIMLAALKEV
ncbi:hypothetical protein KC19_VG232600 [Ceratodon purpureus]|uniref:Uncharacterized protein n=1 Tax=Ceratodon purpureus TaxID=3225 RepID=A0A8T0HTM6_CERPU|nr:hypothetical protein KC19_VG232600 [Ceratodon purpureus]